MAPSAALLCIYKLVFILSTAELCEESTVLCVWTLIFIYKLKFKSVFGSYEIIFFIYLFVYEYKSNVFLL